MLIDSHCHLDRVDVSAFGGNLQKTLENAKLLGVEKVIHVAVTLEDHAKAVDLAEQFEHVFISVGAHPTEAETQPITEAILLEQASHPKVVAIGETGLDYYRPDETPVSVSAQQERFQLQIEVAQKLDKPLIIHTRSAEADTLSMLKAAGGVKGVFHCFTERWEMARQGLDLGLYLSFSGIITFKNAEDLREVVKKTPLDRLLIETDAPWLTPMPYRGKPNYPGYVRYVAECVATIKGVSFEEVAQVTTENALRLFGLV